MCSGSPCAVPPPVLHVLCDDQDPGHVPREACRNALLVAHDVTSTVWLLLFPRAGRGQEPDALTELLEDMKAGPWEQLLHPQQQQQQQEGVTAAHVSTSLLAAARPGGQDAAAGAWGVAAGRPKGVAGWVCSDVPPAAAPGSGWRPGDDVREPVGDQDAALQSNWQQLEGVLPGPSDVDRGFVAGVVRAAVGQVQALAAGYSSGPGKLAWAGGKVHPGQLAGSMSFKQHVEGGEVVAGGQASLAGRLGAASVLLGSV
jgi:hypothetical protein